MIFAERFLGIALLLGVWWIASTQGYLNSVFFSHPDAVLHELAVYFLVDGWKDSAATLGRALAGFGLAVFFAVPIGYLIGSFPRLYRALEFIIDFFRSLPAVAVFPLFLFIFGIGNGPKIALAAFVAFWTVLISTVYGVWHIPIVRQQVAGVFRLTRWRRFCVIILPNMLPELAAGCRVALSLSLILSVVAEMMMGGHYGLGNRVIENYTAFRITKLYAVIAVVGGLGYALNRIFNFAEKRFIHWNGQ